MIVEEKVIEIINEHLPEDHFIVEASFGDNQGLKKLTIILDGDQGVSIDTCALVSRKVGHFLDENEELVDFKYNLEVSSPGADAPFTTFRQYQKNIGREVKVQFADSSFKEGILEEATETDILFLERIKAKDKGRKAKYAAEAVTIKLIDIVKINVIITF